MDAGRLTRGAVAGTIAAWVWAAQMPLDKRVFRSDVDDVKILGTMLTRGPAWRLVGLGIHLANGALFGAAYAVIRPRLPLPAPLCGPVAAIAENTALWPLSAITDATHPARDELPPLLHNGRAFAQETWRHALFGTVLGELERRLNRPAPPSPADLVRAMATNGHGSLEHAASMN